MTTRHSPSSPSAEPATESHHPVAPPSLVQSVRARMDRHRDLIERIEVILLGHGSQAQRIGPFPFVLETALGTLEITINGFPRVELIGRLVPHAAGSGIRAFQALTVGWAVAETRTGRFCWRGFDDADPHLADQAFARLRQDLDSVSGRHHPRLRSLPGSLVTTPSARRTGHLSLVPDISQGSMANAASTER